MSAAHLNEHREGLRRISRWTLFVVVGLFVSSFIWASVAKIDTAVVATGEIRPGGHSQSIRHLEGGTVAEVLKHDGDTVEADEPLFRLQDDGQQAEMRLLELSYQELQVQKAYLQARAAQTERLDIPASIQSGKEPLQSIVDQYQRLLESDAQSTDAIEGANARRIKAQEANVSRATTKVADLEQAITSLDNRMAEVDLADEAAAARAAQLQQSRETLQTELRAARQARQAAADSAAQVKSEISASDGRTASEVRTSVTEVEGNLAEVRVQLDRAKSEVEDLTVTSPLAGIVHEVQPLAAGTRLAPGDIPIEVAPADGEMTVLLRVQPADIDAVEEGTSASIKLSAFAPGTMPDLEGTTTMVASAPDVSQEPQASSYAVEVEIPATHLSDLPAQGRIVPGMPVEAFFTTGRTRVIAYLTDPLLDQIRRSAPG